MKLTFEEKKLLYTYGCADLELTRKRNIFRLRSPFYGLIYISAFQTMIRFSYLHL